MPKERRTKKYRVRVIYFPLATYRYIVTSYSLGGFEAVEYCEPMSLRNARSIKKAFLENFNPEGYTGKTYMINLTAIVDEDGEEIE